MTDSNASLFQTESEEQKGRRGTTQSTALLLMVKVGGVSCLSEWISRTWLAIRCISLQLHIPIIRPSIMQTTWKYKPATTVCFVSCLLCCLALLISFLLILRTRRCRTLNYFYFKKKLLFDLSFLVSAGGNVTSELQDCLFIKPISCWLKLFYTKQSTKKCSEVHSQRGLLIHHSELPHH